MKNFKIFSLGLLLVGLFSSHINAQTIYVDIDATGTGDGSSWTNAFTDLQSGIDAAANLVSGGEVWVADGTYLPTNTTDRTISFTLKDGVSVYGGFVGTETMRSQRDFELNQTILSGDISLGSPFGWSKTLISGGSTIDRNEVLDGFTIRDTYSDNFDGAAINLDGSSPTIRNCMLVNNTSSTGALYAVGNSYPLIENCIFHHNVGDFGTAMIIENNAAGTSTDIIGCLFYENILLFNFSTGPVIFTTSEINIVNTTIVDNATGGIQFQTNNINITNSIIWGNQNYPDVVANGNAQAILKNVIIEDGGTGTNVSTDDPQFNDAANDDYSLTVCSSGNNAGDNTSVPVGLTEDLLGNPRIEATTVDLGAYETTSPIRVSAVELGHPSCFQGSDGQIFINATGGTGTLQYTIDGTNFSTNGTFTGLTRGSHTIGVSDPSGCLFLTTVELVDPPVLTVDSATPSAATCGPNSGSIEVVASGGSAPYTYSIDGTNFQTSSLIENVAPGSYTVLIRDANGCESPMGLNAIVNDQQFEINTLQTQDLVCFGESATQSLTFTFGLPPFEYALDGGAFSSLASNNEFEVEEGGSHFLEIRDDNGCVVSQSFTINSPDLLEEDASSQTNIACSGEATGSISLTAKGGTAPYSYRISSPTVGSFQSTGDFTNLTAGDYTINTVDANGCEFDTDFTLTEATPIDIGATVTSILCAAGNGSISINPVGGSGTYEASETGASYIPISDFNNSLSVIGAGSRTIFVRDGSGCVVSETFTLTDPDPISFDITSTNIGCPGAAIGTAEVVNLQGVSGTAEYSIDGIHFQASASFTNLPLGTFDITVRDANGCVESRSGTISDIDALAVTAASIVATCNGASDGSISISGSGGTSPYEYSIDGMNFQSSGSFENLVADSYSIIVRDANSCTIQVDATVSEPELLTFTTTTENVSCNGESDGSIAVAGSGGTVPYEYSIDGTNFQSSSQFSDLTSGSYNVTIRDSNQCEQTTSISITQPDELTLSVSTTNITCNGDDDGTIALSANGGTSPFQFSIDGTNFSSSTSFDNLEAGSYTVSTIDGNGCTASQVVELTEPPVFSTSSTKQDASCFNAADGTISISTTNGVSPFVHSIDGTDFQSESTFNDLEKGTYTIVSMDASGCSAETTVTIQEPDELSLSASFDGRSINLVASGGTAPYEYSSDGNTFQSEPSFTLANGQYTMTVRDANGCEASTSQEVLVTGIEGNLAGLEVFPNPFQNELSIKSDSKISTIRIYNSSGKMVLENRELGSREIETEFLTSGIYFVEISSEGEKTQVRVIKN